MASSASSSTRNPPSKIRQTNIIDVSSNESSLIHESINNHTIMISTTLALSITPPNASQTLPSQPIEPSPLAPRALIFTSPPTSPHPYLNNIEELPPRSLNPPPFPSLDQINNQTFPYYDLMEYEPFFHLLTSQGEDVGESICFGDSPSEIVPYFLPVFCNEYLHPHGKTWPPTIEQSILHDHQYQSAPGFICPSDLDAVKFSLLLLQKWFLHFLDSLLPPNMALIAFP
ncbi:hypothetical protein Tco_1055466 [Tanacetum coccineum]|uniref:Uncharacterized protein n=1 Tax=Tanacetum coccineum TaxID=301880 RepID=A0ABQ5H0N1_9ASTR